NRRVLLIDLDPQSHATLGLNIKTDINIYNVLSKLTNKKVRLEEIIKNVSGTFDIAPSGIVLSTLEQELAGEISRESRLSEVLTRFSGNYDYILIDCPPNLGILTINAICASNEIIIPVEASRFSLEGLAQLVDIIGLIKDRLNHDVKHQILVTNFDSRLRHSFKILDFIRATFKARLFSTIIHVNVKLKEAQSDGSHILGYDKYCRGAKDYFSLSREIITLEKTPALERIAPVEKAMPEFTKIEDRMQEILKNEIPKLTESIFAVNAPSAKEVHIVGDFNGWELGKNSSMDFENGRWVKKMPLDPGKYHYRFVIDGEWIEDPSNPQKEKNAFGSMNSLIEIKNVE
ncbi:MAG: hypothetical protein FJZ15_06020, partial [Candidatus Omnitrophica bacterium]|nr:hypothetical protein [Candidatus Omnitrophota bacterium]